MEELKKTDNMVFQIWNALSTWWGQFLAVDKWLFLGFGGAGISGVSTFFDGWGETFSLIGGGLLLLISIMQKLSTIYISHKGFRNEEKRKDFRLKHGDTDNPSGRPQKY